MLRTTVTSSARVLNLSLIAFLLSPATLVFAQGVLEEVIVTAQKREESIQDVGIAITAFSGEQLDALGITDSTAIAEFTPGRTHLRQQRRLHPAVHHPRRTPRMTSTTWQRRPMRYMWNEAYQAAGQAQLFSQFDMGAGGAPKGPQGTLFGRNATGGLVHYVTKKPTEEFEGYGDFQYGRYDTVRFEGAVSGPLAEGIKARVSGVLPQQ